MPTFLQVVEAEVCMGWLKKRYSWVVILCLLLAAGSIGRTRMNHFQLVTLPVGTEIPVRLNQSIATNRSASGDPFRATVAEPIMMDGKTVVPQGAAVMGRIVYVNESGRLEGSGSMRLALESVEVNGDEYDLHTTTFARRGSSREQHNLAMNGSGAESGVLIGALAGGGMGTSISGPVRAGAAAVATPLTGKEESVLPAETVLTFELVESLSLNLKVT
jgi:hypothetical protein